MGAFSIWQWLIVLVVVALIFGTKKLRNLGGDVGGAVKGFKNAMNEGSETQQTTQSLDNSASEESVESGDIVYKEKQ